MFAYCNNSPIITADFNGEWVTVVIGATVGAGVSALFTLAQQCVDIHEGTRAQIDTDAIFVSAICGAFSGVFGATGAGGVVGQMAAGAFSSALDSGYQNYTDYKQGKSSLREAVVGTVVDTAIGATMGAVGYEGTHALKTSDIVSGQAVKAAKKLTQKGLHPTVKATAKATVRKATNYARKEVKTSVVDNFITSLFTVGLSKTIAKFF